MSAFLYFGLLVKCTRTVVNKKLELGRCKCLFVTVIILIYSFLKYICYSRYFELFKWNKIFCSFKFKIKKRPPYLSHPFVLRFQLIAWKLKSSYRQLHFAILQVLPMLHICIVIISEKEPCTKKICILFSKYN